MDRRRFLLSALAGPLLAPHAVLAQATSKIPRIGVLYTNTPTSPTGLNPAFWERLRELGWVDGQMVTVERRGAVGDFNRLPALAAELMGLNVDVIAMDNGAAAKRVDDSTRPTPICVAGGDLQAAGAVKNLARPEGHITGVQLFQPDLVGKRVAILKDTITKLQRVGLLTGSRNSPGAVVALRTAEEACRAAAVDLYVKEVPTAEGLDQAFAELTRARVQGVIVLNHPVFTVNKDQVMALASKSRLPAIYEYSSWPESGGLMSYGAVFTEIYRQLAECVDKVLRGAKPIDLPVQQSTTFELVINLKSARGAGAHDPALGAASGESGDPVAHG